ncbi:RloB family protein [Actinomyces gaoshouyii]|uniref:RloB family protein n=1 Tax=Actinomyces gaoshouyii TaxID=1960083 RepID=UPI0009B51522|nr:RloB family protein [Actinomyces gaoshouyii]
MTNGQRTEQAYLEPLKKKVGRSIALTIRFSNRDPLSLIKELRRPRSDLDSFDEAWIVVDHDGENRSDFLRACGKLSKKSRPVHGVVSVPCFEVWLAAHYCQVRNYQDQRDARRHYAQIAHVREGEKSLPKDFPWDAVAEATQRCRLVGIPEPELDTQGPCPSTTMPHLMRGLGLL